MTNPLFRMPAVTDGITAVERWINSSPHDQRKKLLASCSVLLADTEPMIRPVFSVPTAAADFLRQHGGLDDQTSESDVTREEVTIDALSARLLLCPGNDAPPVDSVLILAEHMDEQAFAELLSALSLIETRHQELLLLEAESGESVMAIELRGADPACLTDGSLGPIDVLQVRDLGFRVATPLGLVHPMVEFSPALIQIQGSGNSVLLWRSDPSDELKGAFVSMTVRDQRIRHPADLFTLTAGTFAAIPPNNEITPPPIEIHLEQASDGAVIPDHRTTRILLELKESAGGRTMRRLLDIMDEVESGLLDTEARIWSSRIGAGAASPTSHHVCFRTQRLPSDYAGRGARVFAQPANFEAHGIPLFIEVGYELRPAVDSFLETLPNDHPLIQQLTRDFPAKTAGGDCHHFLQTNPHGNPSHKTLVGGELLTDHIGTIVAEAVALPPGSSPDATAARRLAESIRGERDRNLLNIREVAEAEAREVQKEFDSVLADLTRHVDDVEDQLSDSALKTESLTKLANDLVDLLKEAPRDWWTLHNAVDQINSQITTPRLAWLETIDGEKKSYRTTQAETIQRINDASELVDSRIVELRKWLKAAQDARSTLNKKIASAEALSGRLANTSKEASKDHQKATSILDDVTRQTAEEDERLARKGEVILRRQQALEVRQRANDAKKKIQGEQESAIRERSKLIDAEHQRLLEQEARLEAEVARLDLLEHKTIPALEQTCRSMKNRIDRVDAPALERKLNELRAGEMELKNLRVSLESRLEKADAGLADVERREKFAAEQKERAEKQEQILEKRIARLRRVQAAIAEKKAKLDQANRELHRRETEAESQMPGKKPARPTGLFKFLGSRK